MNANKRQKFFQIGLVFIFSLLLVNPPSASSFAQKQNSGGAGTAGGEKAGAITMQTVSGTVVETMNSGGYTYALIDEGSGKTWVALPESRVAVGNEITCKPGMVMNNFSSSSLRRTFTHIVFSGGITSYSAGTATPLAEEPAPEEAPEMPKVKDTKDWGEFFEKK